MTRGRLGKTLISVCWDKPWQARKAASPTQPQGSTARAFLQNRDLLRFRQPQLSHAREEV